MSHSEFAPKVGLEAVGLTNLGGVLWNPTPATLYEEFVMNGEGVIANGGPIVAETGKYTGRSPDDKFVVEEPSSKAQIWWGKVNRPFDEDKFVRLVHRVQAYLQDGMVYVQAGAGIVADSDPQAEQLECEYKARALFRAAEEAVRVLRGERPRHCVNAEVLGRMRRPAGDRG